MKKGILLFSAFLFSLYVVKSQVPNEFIKTWYLVSFSTSQGEIFVEDLDVPQGPSITISENFTIVGNSFCNEFNGEYIFVNMAPFAVPHTFQPINIVRTTNECGNNEQYESRFFQPIEGENEADVLVLQEDFLVLQWYHPEALYQTYSNEPVLNTLDHEITEILVFPNPAEEILFISGSSLHFESVDIFSVGGYKISTIEPPFGSGIDISGLDSGMYIVRISSEENTTYRKFVKR